MRRANLLVGDGEPRCQHLHDEFVDLRRERRVFGFETTERRQREPENDRRHVRRIFECCHGPGLMQEVAVDSRPAAAPLPLQPHRHAADGTTGVTRLAGSTLSGARKLATITPSPARTTRNSTSLLTTISPANTTIWSPWQAALSPQSVTEYSVPRMPIVDV